MRKMITFIILIIILSSTLSSAANYSQNNKNNLYKNNSEQNDFVKMLVNYFEENLDESLPDDLESCCVKKTYMVPMRDGIKLATDVYLPILVVKPYGTVLLRTPYNKDEIAIVGYIFAFLGWPTVIQDMRGRYASEGDDTVYRNDHTDGPDTLQWIVTRDWSNGKVATVGPSALGIVQYLMAGNNPPELACQGIMVASPNLYKHAIYQGGQFRKELVEGWLKGQNAEYMLPEIWENENYTLDFWTNVSLDDNWPDVNVPAIHFGGWYDAFQQGITDGYHGYQHLAGPGARGKSMLIMGPWYHDGYITTKQGQLVYPENSLCWFAVEIYLQMIKKYTMNENNNFDNYSKVYYYIMGDVDTIDAPGNEWRTSDDWPIQATNTSWYLHDDGLIDTSYPSDYEPITYQYNPTNPVPTLGGQLLEMPPGPYDQTPVENREDVLVFTSPVLTEPYEATGPIKAKLYVSSDCVDTDFTVKLTDVYPDGRSMIITDGILRMRNRNGQDHWEFMQPGQIYEINIDMWSTSYIWNIGHRIRVAVSSSNYPRFLNNPNTDDPIYKNTTYNIANNTLYLDSQHPSCIILPEIEQKPTSNPPEKPTKPSGRLRIKVNQTYKYSSSTNDPDGDQVYLLFDWDDGTSSGWLGPINSGETVTAKHKWTTKGKYEVRVKAKDINGTQSEWSDPLAIIAPRYKTIPLLKLFEKIIELFPNAFPILRQLLLQ